MGQREGAGALTYDPQKRRRRSIRLKGYDYAQAGAYFVTICTQERACLFGQVVDGEMRMNHAGEIVAACWEEIAAHFPNAISDIVVVMPNHVHGIVFVGARHAVPLHHHDTKPFGKPVSGSLPTVIRSFKSAAAKRINVWRGTPGMAVWQRNYHEHIIRDERSLELIRAYISQNPLQWELDRENPIRVETTTRPADMRKSEPWRI